MTTQTCVTCQRATDLGRRGCHRCVEAVRRWLRAIESYEQIRSCAAAALPARRSAGSQIRGTGYGSMPPCDLDVLTAGDPRSTRLPLDRAFDAVTDDEEPLYYILGVLESEARNARESLGDPQPFSRATLMGEIGYLLYATERIAYEDWWDDYHHAIRDLHGDSRRVARDSANDTVAPCIAVGCDGRVLWQYDVHLPPERRRDAARCVDCGRSYEGIDLLRLRVQEAS